MRLLSLYEELEKDNIFDYYESIWKYNGFSDRYNAEMFSSNGCKLAINFQHVLYINHKGWVTYTTKSYSEYKDDKVFILTEIYCPNSNEGMGTNTMKQLIEGADKYGYIILIEPTPIGNYETTLEKEGLINWYSKFGFELKDNGDIMQRNPK
jgi:hypothetical protein